MVNSKASKVDVILLTVILLLITISLSVLRSIIPEIFPSYFIYIAIGLLLFLFFSRIEFKILMYLYRHIYVVCVVLLLIPLIIGDVTRGAIRWIPLGPIAIQPSELVRPFLILFAATYLTMEQLTMKRIISFSLYAALPVLLIIIQPSFGVATLTSIAFFGVVLASTLNKKYIFVAILAALSLLPAAWFVMEPYQKERIVTFLEPSRDPLGAGYNSIQSMISVGSGKLLGRGLGQGVQTQLDFLPERHNDFVFASIAEELGFVGSILLFFCLFALMWRLTDTIERSKNPTARAYISGLFFVLFFQMIFNIGMNMGLFPITGIPLPLISSGGSSLMATLVGLGIASNCRRD